MEQGWQDFLQWLGIGGAGGGAMFSLGRKTQQIESLEDRIEQVEAATKVAMEKTIENGKSLAELKATTSLTFDLVKEMREDLRSRP
jgi:hypothetical protein